MIRYTIAFIFCLTSLAGFAQEICNNGIDDDHDGFIDCYDGSCAEDPLCDGFLGNDANCEVPPAVFPKFTMALDFASPDETTNHLSRMVVGDLDRDGIPEIATMNRYTKKLFILNGSDGSIKKEATVNFEPYWEIAIANLDNDNCGEIFFIGYQNLTGSANDGVFLYAYDCNLNFLWQSAKKLPDDPINFGVADFDGDGQEEIYAKDEIFDAKTGVRLVKSAAPIYNRINGGPVAADILGDEKLELIIGLNIYQVNLGTRTSDAGSLTLLDNRSEYFVRHEYNATSIADYNLDGYLDVLASGSTSANGKNTTVFFWDVHNDELKTYSDFQPGLGTGYAYGWVNGTGRLNIADLDGNGKMNASFVSGRFLYALDENFQLLWRVNINEETSGHTGCTLFDFNGDGKAEIVYRDERFLYIIEGTDGSIYSQQACISRTNREYPIVADVDADGSTELCVTCGFNDKNSSDNFGNLGYSRYSHIRVFKSAAEPWVPARRVWNQHGYFVVNVNDDLTIPTVLQKHQLVFSTGSCTVGPNRPLNKFLNQAPYLNSEGCPTYASPDIAFEEDPTIIPPNCPEVNFKVSFKLTNKGDVAITGDIPISFYTTNPLKAGAVKLATINTPVSQLEKGQVVSIVDQVIPGIGSDSVYVVLNDAGTSVPTPIVLPNTSFFECDYDNIRAAKINPLPVSIQATTKANETCGSGDNGVASAFVPDGSGKNTTDYTFYWSIGAVAKPIPSADFVGAVYANLPSNTYTVFARHKTANCNSSELQVVISDSTTSIPSVTVNVISNQTACSPFNGKAEAVVEGGSSGYDIEWFDISLSPLGITGPIVNNLSQGNYLARVSKNDCFVNTTFNITGPTVPDVDATVQTDAKNCSNPNSGKVTAQALVSGLGQDSTKYNFHWYYYNNATSSKGSVIAPGHGTGPTRTGLAAGFYLVEAEDKISGCRSAADVVEVKGTTTLHDAAIVVLKEQTSCDLSLPNGSMTANVTVGGVPQSPSAYTFEWFKGANTLPANKVNTVSDENGKTVNNVAGGGIVYTVKVSDAFNCFVIKEEVITEEIIKPVVTLAQLTPNTICDPSKASMAPNGSIKASVTFDGVAVTVPNAAYVFTWRDPLGNPISVADNTNPVLSGLLDGNSYSVTVEKIADHCISDPDTEPVVKQTILPALQTTSTGSNNCDPALTPDGTASVTVMNATVGDAFKYQWYAGSTIVPGNELSATNQGNQANAILLGGPVGAPKPYSVLVTNTVTGCETTAIQAIADKSQQPVVGFVNATPNTICSPSSAFNGSIEAAISNLIGAVTDYTFTWYNGNTNDPANKNTSSTTKLLANQNAGSYTVEVYNTVTGCQSIALTGQIPDGRVFPAISFNSTGSNTCDPSLTPDGSLQAVVTNGGTSFSYAWTSVAPAKPVDVPVNHADQQTLIKIGGPSNAPNQYQVLVINTATGCQNTGVGLVADTSKKPELDLDVNPNRICSVFAGGPSNFSGSIEVTAVNHPKAGTSSSSFEWFTVDYTSGSVIGSIPGETNALLDQLDNGKYGVRAKIGDLGCSSEIEIVEVLDDVVNPVITTAVTPSTNCAPVADNGTAQVTAPLTGHIYQWYSGSVIDPANLLVGKTGALLGTTLAGGTGSNFTVLVTNLTDGCSNNKVVNVPDGKVIPTVSLSVIRNNSICNFPTITPDGELLATVTNAGTNYTVNWLGGTAQSLATGTHQESFTKLQPGSYEAFVINNETGCQSSNDTQSVLNDVVYPVVAMTVTDQTSCNPASPNGMLVASDGGSTTDRSFEWFAGIGTGSGIAVDGGDPANQIDDLASADYTVRVTNTITGCASLRSEFIPQHITFPAITFSAIAPVTKCSTPDGAVTPAVSNASTNFSIYYVFTDDDGIPPADAATVTSSPSIPARNNLTPYNNLRSGFVTAVVINNTTGCISNPFTGIVPDNRGTYNINITGTSPATNCGDANGGADITVTGGSGLYIYKWYSGTPDNENIDFITNPPAFSVPVIATTQDLGVSAIPAVTTVTTGNYTVVVTDQNSGCGNFFVTNIPFADVPAVSVSSTDNAHCVGPNGSITVNVTPGPVNTSGYSILLYAGNTADPANVIKGEVCFDGLDNDGDGLTDGADPDCGGLNLTANALAEGDYLVQVFDNDALNRPCPLLHQETVLKIVKNPLVDASQITANTSCDVSVVADGKVELKVTTQAGDAQAKDYYLSSIAPLPSGFTLNPSPGNKIGNGSSGQTTGLINGFKPQLYTFRVLDDISKCFTDYAVTIPNQESLPGALNAVATPETMCAPGSNGSALASLSSGEAVTRFDFDWVKNSDGTGNVTGGLIAGGGATNGQSLNQGKIAIPADWAIGSNGFGSGSRTYYVRATRNATAPVGFDCPTPLTQVVIQDEHAAPNLALSANYNSICNATDPGDTGDAQISVTADADPSAPGAQNAAGGFNYSWTNANAVLTSPQTGQSNNFAIPGMGTTNVIITATNVDNNCVVVNDVDVLSAPFNLQITSFSVTNQMICNADGEINVREIAIDRTALGLPSITHAATLPLTSLYDFNWFAADPSDENTVINTPLKDVGASNINGQDLAAGTAAGKYSAMRAGTYYVSATRKNDSGTGAGCSTPLLKIKVEDEHQNPVVAITPFSNTSCMTAPGSGEGRIEIKITDGTSPGFGTPFNYNYNWTAGSISDSPTNDGDGDISDGDGDVITDLETGIYALTVTNTTSGCSTNVSAEILLNKTPLFVQEVDVKDQLSCDPLGDGRLDVTKVTLIDRNGNSQTIDGSNISDFEFDWSRSTIAFTQTTTGTSLHVGNYDAAGFGIPIGAGTYNVTARRISAAPGEPGVGCESAPFQVVVLDKRINPVGVLTPLANTSCDNSNPEGAIAIEVSDATLVSGPHTFTYTWDASNPTAIVTSSPGNNDGDGAPSDGDEDVAANLLHGAYSVTIRNNQSQCVSTASTTILKNATPIIIPQATADPQVLCSADGQITIDAVNITDRDGSTSSAPLGQFQFTWFRNDLTNQVAVTDGALAGGTILGIANYNQIGIGTYFVIAKNLGGTLGKDCESVPFQAVIDDMRKYPEVNFTQAANSSCDTSLPNGAVSVSVKETNGVSTGPYTFTWSLNAGPLHSSSAVTSTANSSSVSNAIDGSYKLIATNTVTSCPVTSEYVVILDRTASTPNIIDAKAINPTDCNASGSAMVTKITIGSDGRSIITPNEISGAGLNNYNYEWYTKTGATFDQLPLSGPPYTNAPQITGLFPGSYFVIVHDPTTNCKSGMREVMVSPDDIIPVVVNIELKQKQILCNGNGSAILEATADGFTDANSNYLFQWFSNATQTLPVFATTSRITDLLAGDYSVKVKNQATSCEGSAFYLVEDQNADFAPLVSMGQEPRTSCISPDGVIIARVTNLSADYPYTYDANTFTADLYIGATPDLSAAPAVADIAAVPGFITNFRQENLAANTYTVRIKDNNTGCFGVGAETIQELLHYPAVVIDVISPVTNCNVDAPNGVAVASADGQFAAFSFDWYEGNSVTGSPVYSGPHYSELKPQPTVYTLRVSANESGCFTDANTSINFAPLPVPVPTAEVLSNLTSCITLNGAVGAYVGADRNTRDYIFNWYNGLTEKTSPDFTGEIYDGLDAGPYSVTATNIYTGCKSEPVTAEVLKDQKFPDFDFTIENASCENSDGFATLVMLSDVPLESIVWADDRGPFLTGPNYTNAKAGVYTVTATTFSGCEKSITVAILADIKPFNGISRNHDGMNDYFKIDCIEMYPENEVKIFNRAGTLVYEAVGYDNNGVLFDGISNKGINLMGSNLPDGTYFYIIDKRNGSKPLIGYLEIVK